MTALPCPPQHWTRFSTLLDEAMELSEGDRDEWLALLAGEDEALRPWLSRVLGSAAGVGTGDFLDGCGVAGYRLMGQAGAGEPPPDLAPGDVVGPYRLVAPLGEGGMGQVWRASRSDDGPARPVALKLPHAELLGGPFRTRFRRERDMLAELTHPNIAALYDAGVAAGGRPYLALELVSGQPITTHCKAAAMPLERRIGLVRQVLGALGCAHARLIVHRDIKPSNVLVTPEGEVKLLDFGIAKLLDPDQAGEEDALTQPAARLATPGYAPPEQMEGGRITVSADLFAVGVLLFELCTGQRPPRLHSTGEATPLASSRADAKAANLPDGAGLARRLRGDLDAIIAKALSIDPAQRYGSADHFAHDLRRWQDGLPISARRIGPWALAGKFVRRNRLAAGLTGLLALALLGGVAGVAWQAHRAEREAARALAIKDFLIGLFQTGDAASAGRRLDTMTARDLLDRGADTAAAAFPHDPETEIELLGTLGKIYDWADEPARAEHVWQRRLDLARASYGPADPRVVEGTLSLATSEVMFLHDDAAKSLLERIRAPLSARYGPDSLPWAEWLTTHALTLRATHGGREEALADDLAAVAIFKARFPTDRHYHDALDQLAGYQFDAEDYAGSLATIEARRAMDIARHDFDPSDDLVYHTDAASRLERLGRRDEAEAYYAWSQAQAERQFGKQSLWYIYALIGRAQVAHMHGERATAARFFGEALAINQARAAVSGQSTSLRRAYGGALAREGRAAEAIPILETVLAETLLHGHDEQNVRRTRAMLGDAYDQAGRAPQARALLHAAREDWMRYGPADGIQSLGVRERWARFLLDHGDADGASAEFGAVVQLAHGRAIAPASLAQAGLARLALARGDLAAATALSGEAMANLAAITSEFDIRASVDVRLTRADSLAASGEIAAARALARSALDDARAWDAPGSARIARASDLVARLDGIGK